jgi:hypothetical protein
MCICVSKHVLHYNLKIALIFKIRTERCAELRKWLYTCKCNISVVHFVLWTEYRATKDIMKFSPYSCQYVRQPLLLKRRISTPADILDMIWISTPNFSFAYTQQH